MVAKQATKGESGDLTVAFEQRWRTLLLEETHALHRVFSIPPTGFRRSVGIVDPFTIHCSSCQSRIRVRNPSMIGQIANCPKCGSMIMIAAPQPPAAAPQQILVDSGTGSVTDSVALTKEAMPVPDEGLLGEVHPLEHGFDQAFRSEGLPDVTPPDPNPFESLSPASWMPEPTPPPRVDEVAPSTPPPPRSDSRQIMLVAAIGLCSVAVACGIFFAFLRWYARPSTVASNSVPANQAAAGSPNIVPPLAASVSATEPLDGPSLDGTSLLDPVEPLSPSAQPNAPSDVVAGEQPITEPGSTDATATTPIEIDVSPSPAPDSLIAAARPLDTSGAPLAAGESTTTGSSTVPSGSSLDSQLMPDIDSTFANPGAEENAEVLKETLPPGLQSFASIFDRTLVPVLSDSTVPLSAAPDAGDAPNAGNNAPVTDESAPAVSPMTLSLPETLEHKQATTLNGLLIQRRPLAEVLSTLSLMSDIPFTADLDGLLAAGVDREQVVDFKSGTPVKVVDVLGLLAQDYGLSFEPYEKKLLIVRGPADAVQSRVPASLPIADLIDGEDQTTALSAALGELLPELGDGFQLGDGSAQADLEKVNRLLWFQVARLLETWRQARGLQNVDSAAIVPKSSLLPAWPVHAAEKLAQKSVSQRLLPEPLAFTWHRCAADAGMTCWVDWPSLVSAQTPPGQIGMSISYGRPLQELLQHDADKYDVVFAIENERTLWVTSPTMHRFQPRLYVLPIDGKTVDEWRKELEPLTPFDPDGREALKVVASPDGQFVFIRCCRPLLAQPQP